MFDVFGNTSFDSITYYIKMQEVKDNIKHFKYIVGQCLKKIREEKYSESLNRFAREYDINRANLSKIERGNVGCSLITAWKIAEALNIKFSEFAKILEEQLGNDFKLIDE